MKPFICKIPDSVRSIRGLHLDRPHGRVDHVFRNGWGAVVTEYRNGWGRTVDGIDFSVLPVHYDPVTDRFDWIGVVFPEQLATTPYGHLSGDAKLVEATLAKLRRWPTAPQPPDWPAAVGVVYLIADLGPFGGGIVAKSSYHGYLGLRGDVLAQRVSGIPAGTSAKSVMIARNNAVTVGNLPAAKLPECEWRDLAPFNTEAEDGLRSVPACFEALLGPGFVDETA